MEVQISQFTVLNESAASEVFYTVHDIMGPSCFGSMIGIYTILGICFSVAVLIFVYGGRFCLLV